MQLERPGTTSSNMRSTSSATAVPASRAAMTDRSRQRTTQTLGRRTVMPVSQRRTSASKLCSGSRTATRCRSRPGAIGLNRMGDERVTPLAEPIAPFASRAVDVAALLPDLAWPAQIELRAGKHMVRPRYEVIGDGRRRIAHVNVERTDLRPDPRAADARRNARQRLSAPRPDPAAGPVGRLWCCRRRWRFARPNCRLPRSSMIRRVTRFCAARWAGCRADTRRRSISIEAGIDALGDGYGHVELVYDFSKGEKPTAGCMRSSATATARVAMPPRPALALMSSTRF